MTTTSDHRPDVELDARPRPKLPAGVDLDSSVGTYGGTSSTHVSNLLARARSVGNELTPELIRRMRRHYQVSACLIVQSLPLLRADWAIECDDADIGQWLTEAYRRVAFDVHRSMSRAMPYGYSPNELVFDVDEDLGGIVVSEVRDLEPSTCKPRTNDRGSLDGFVQRVPGGGQQIPIDNAATLWVVEGMESGNLYGRSILEAALDPWSDFAALRAFHARYLERFGEPVVKTRAPSGRTVANAAEIEQAVAAGDTPPAPILVDNLTIAQEVGQNLRHHSVVAFPGDLAFGADGKPYGYAWDLEYVEATGGHGSDFLEAIRETDKRIARAMFIPDLLFTNTDTGAYALGQSHRSVWGASVEGRLDDYSRQITRQLVDRLRRWNFGDNAPAARLVFAPQGDDDRDRLWSIAEALISGGRLPVDVSEIGNRLGLPMDEEEESAPPAEEETEVEEVDGEEELARGRESIRLRQAADTLAELADELPPATELPDPHVPGDPGQRADAAPVEPHAVTRFASENPVAGLPEWKIPSAYDPPPFRRELNNRERRVGFAKLEDGLNRTEARVIDQLEGMLERERERVLRQLTGVVRKGSTSEILAGLGSIEIRGETQLASAWAALMGDVGSIAVEGLRDELADYAASLPTTVGKDAEAMFRAYASTAAERVTSQVTSEVRLELLNAYTSGVSRAGMAAVVSELFDAYETSEGRGPRLTTRMLSSKALNYTRASAVERGGVPLRGAQYSAVLDRRTCELCERQDELVIPIEHTDLARFTPPVHHNCRCVWVWITRQEEDFTPTWTTPPASTVDRFGGLVF